MKDTHRAAYPTHWLPPAKEVTQGIFGYAWVGLVLIAVVVLRLFGLVFFYLTWSWLERLARKLSHTSQFIHSGRYNMSRVRVIGCITPTVTSNRDTRASQANRSSLPSRTFHSIQSRINSHSRHHRQSIQS